MFGFACFLFFPKSRGKYPTIYGKIKKSLREINLEGF